jgi:hypothetical protein
MVFLQNLHFFPELVIQDGYHWRKWFNIRPTNFVIEKLFEIIYSPFNGSSYGNLEFQLYSFTVSQFRMLKLCPFEKKNC